MYIIPKPNIFNTKKGSRTISFLDRIIISRELGCKADHTAKLLNKELMHLTGFDLTVTRGNKKINSIFLCINAQIGQQGYELNITEEGIVIEGSDDAGLLYGVQTLRQLVKQAGVCLPCLEIKDEPDIYNRGFYHDVSRGRVPTLDYLKRLADRLAYYKMNQLQLYIEHTFLFSGLSELWRDDTPLTPEEIMELDSYCRSLQIDLVPSISSFGHLHKLLGSKSYKHLCELPDSDKEPFTFDGRMHHHTVDVSNPESIALIKDMILEIMPLFTSKLFNICADETFDLGKGKSKAMAEEMGVDRIYLNYVKELCEFIVQQGKIPMFWGDIICGFPEAVKELPKETICLNWGYAPQQNEDSSKSLYEAAAAQYSCPGVAGWNQFVNLIEPSYQNIMRMCSYARKYHSIGILNTDWGDFGHINHPDFGIAGMIFGAAFSWTAEVIPFDELCEQISKLEFADSTGKLIAVAARIAENSIFKWEYAVKHLDSLRLGKTEESTAYLKECDLTGLDDANLRLIKIEQELYGLIGEMDTEKRALVKPYLVALWGTRIFNDMGAAIAKKRYKSYNGEIKDTMQLAEELETWFYEYKKLWRSVSRESELYRIQDVMLYYGDLLRELS